MPPGGPGGGAGLPRRAAELPQRSGAQGASRVWRYTGALGKAWRLYACDMPHDIRALHAQLLFACKRHLLPHMTEPVAENELLSLLAVLAGSPGKRQRNCDVCNGEGGSPDGSSRQKTARPVCPVASAGPNCPVGLCNEEGGSPDGSSRQKTARPVCLAASAGLNCPVGLTRQTCKLEADTGTEQHPQFGHYTRLTCSRWIGQRWQLLGKRWKLLGASPGHQGHPRGQQSRPGPPVATAAQVTQGGVGSPCSEGCPCSPIQPAGAACDPPGNPELHRGIAATVAPAFPKAKALRDPILLTHLGVRDWQPVWAASSKHRALSGLVEEALVAAGVAWRGV